MRILFDHQTFSNQLYGGISRYFTELIIELEKKPEFQVMISSLVTSNYYLLKYGLKKRTYLSTLNFKGKKKLYSLINNSFTKNMLKKQNYDIFHPTYFDPYFLDFVKNKKYVVTAHDMIYEIFDKESFHHKKIKNDIKIVTQSATHIIAVSNNTKSDLIKYYNIDPQKITVVYHGYKSHQDSITSIHSLMLPSKYVLYVGDRNGYKNFDGMIMAISKTLSEYNYFLICAGGKKISKEEGDLLNSQGIMSKVLFLPSVTDQELFHLYRNAIAFLFPSMYEGFGMPILEAMGAGCPVLLSNTSCFPEIAGDAALYFDPYNTDSIYQCLNKFVKSSDMRDGLIEKGYRRVKKFSWENTCKKTAKVYKNIME